MTRLSAYIDFLNAGWTLRLTYEESGDWKFILGEYEERLIGDARVRIFQREWVRAPHNALSIIGAYENRTRTIFIRRESAEVIFSNKWMPNFDAETRRECRHPDSAIAGALKSRALSVLGIDAKDEKNVLASKDYIVNAIIDSTMWSELGVLARRRSPRNCFIDQPLAHLVSGTDSPNNTFAAIISDWMDEEGREEAGTMIMTAKLARENPTRAQFLYWEYLSDYWFATKNDDPFPFMTDISHAIALLVIGEDGNPDFTKVERFKEPVRSMLFDRLATFRAGLTEFVHDLPFVSGKEESTWEQTCATFRERFTRLGWKGLDAPGEDKTEHPAYAREFWGWVSREYLPEYDSIQAEIQKLTDEARGAVFSWILERSGEEVSPASLRDFIRDTYRNLGVIQPESKTDWDRLIGKALQANGGEDHYKGRFRESILEKIQLIKSGTPVEACEFSNTEEYPFIAFLQWLLADADDSGIESTGEKAAGCAFSGILDNLTMKRIEHLNKSLNPDDHMGRGTIDEEILEHLALRTEAALAKQNNNAFFIHT